MVSLEEWTEWKLHPMTQEWFKLLTALREQCKEDWAQSLYVGELEGESLQRNAGALGQVYVLTKLQHINYEEMVETLYDNRQ
jgi:hypothetical protein